MMALILLLSIIPGGNGSIFDSTEPYDFLNQDIHCNNSEACIITCDETSACKNANIYCPDNYSCSITCSAASSCNDATIKWPIDNSIGHISCLESITDPACFGVNFPIPSSNENYTLNCIKRKCEGSIIYCPDNANCKINCNGLSSCAATQFIWSTNGNNELICNGELACESVNFPVPTDDNGYYFQCNGENICESADIYCPTNHDCHIECAQDYACEETIIHWSTNPSVTSTLTCGSIIACQHTSRPPVFATNNDENFYLNCDSNYECHYAVIYCPTNAECHITCGGNSACDGISINWPENHAYSLTCQPGDSQCTNIVYNPTLDPTTQPTTNPTIFPSSNPTVFSSSNPTIIPSLNPTIIITSIHPTADPTIEPTMYPTLYPTIYAATDPTSILHPTINPIMELNDSNSNILGISKIMIISIIAIGGGVFLIAMVAMVIILKTRNRNTNNTNDITKLEIQNPKNVMPIISDNDVWKRMNQSNEEEDKVNDSDDMYDNANKKETNANGENNRHSDSDDLYDNQDDVKEDIETKGTKRNDDEEHEDQLEGKKEETNEEYEEITNMLKEVVYGEWKRYLRNFKKHKVNDERLKLIGDANSVLWQELIPEIGIRLQFYALSQGTVNSTDTNYV